MNNNENLIISSSDDHTIKFQIKQNVWICQQTITDHKSYVYQLSLSQEQDKLISCRQDQLILRMEYLEDDKKLMVIQKIQVDCLGYRLCFKNDNFFTFQPDYGNMMHVNEMNSVNRQNQTYYCRTR
ncbi:unnamed protein product [Paramecium sonneborni]|uniref:Uncharacterized protein n=1 Tax=Paramecium sonneborni TaxID=65129 RepID=A0A8S1R4L2_9CILI|nr:unnamed protein product [Paramecium sonneborni]